MPPAAAGTRTTPSTTRSAWRARNLDRDRRGWAADHQPLGSQLRVSKCGDAACGSGNILSVLDGPQGLNVGIGNSIAIGPDSLAVVSHYNATEQALRISKCGNLACN